MKKTIILFSLLFLPLSLFSKWTPTSLNNEKTYFDAIVFASDSTGLGRVDAFTIVPYETIHFIEARNGYGAKYELMAIALDSVSRVVEKKEIERSLYAEDYFVTQGGSAKFDHSQLIFNLKPGKYEIKSIVKDKFNNKEYSRSRQVNVLDFDKFDFALSGMMLVSSIEERDGKYIITPHLSDNIADLEEGFFTFFEAYNKKDFDEISLQYEIIDNDDKIINISEIETRKIKQGKNQIYLKIKKMDDLQSGKYTLRISAYEGTTSNQIIAITQRTIKVKRSVFAFILDDIDLAIRQLRYAAYPDELKFIKDGESEEQRRQRFIKFWEKRDPSPGTKRNEAFQEYYSRVYYAEKAFDSYSKGWMSDKGMVYIIFGPPFQVDQSTDYYGTKRYERWQYQNNREFLFVDNSGFGDFRLYRPMTVTEKYRYEK